MEIKNPNSYVITAIILSIVFIEIGHFYRDEIQSRLKTPLLHVKAFDIDWWSVSHFLLFAFFGFVKPHYALSFFVGGALFELFEDGMSSDKTTQTVTCDGNNDTLIKKIMCNGFEDSYWYGKIDDIAMNLIGYVVGQSIILNLC